LHQADSQAFQRLACEGDAHGLVAGGRRHFHLVVASSRDEINELPLGRHLDGKIRHGRRGDDYSENALVEVLGEQELSQAPF
jgi:hypothetical protein